MVAHPTPEILAEIGEVRSLVHARGETIERNEKVCGKLSHAKLPFKHGFVLFIPPPA
jgi:hypothetical protein